MKITSKQNVKIKAVKRLHRRRYRDQSGLFIAEGLRLVEDMLHTKAVTEVYYIEQLLANKRGQAAIAIAKQQGIPTYLCSDGVLEDIFSTESAQGIIAVVKQPELVSSWERHLQHGVILIVDQVQDPGNLGTILRTALAAGIDGVWLVKGTVDPFNHKTVRSSMGAILGIPFSIYTHEQCLAEIDKYGLQLFVTDLTDGEIYHQSDYGKQIALVVGNEANGVHAKFLQAADRKVYLPLANSVESLNVAVATGVLLYEIVRQRTLQ